jgi:DNA-binding NtrC family response regulator
MTKVLVVDDEQGYRDLLELHLSREGYAVKTATTGREAIDLGVRYRPDVLVIDWMLRNHLHGLHVVDVLRVVDPALRTILMTGFSSGDLQAEVARAQVHAFIEKPFDLDDLLREVQDAARVEPVVHSQLSIAVLEVDAAGTIVYANAYAREWLALSSPGPARRLADLWPHNTLARLHEATEDWVEILLPALRVGPQRWQLRVRAYPEGTSRLLVLLPGGKPYLRDNPLLQMLLALPGPTSLWWPDQDPVLVIDNEILYRHLIVAQLESVGCLCHTAATYGEGVQLFQRDPAVSAVILASNEFSMPSHAIRQLVATLTTLQPTVRIVGTSAVDRRRAFAAVGVRHFLLKPWKAEDLIRMLSSPFTPGGGP